ncbi:hypothetical protein V6N13_122358 [Hibiscus sabdariffa]|uniref:Uncharacterized protein n=1 Tax=Hibiscus sabdariffa TaxID=183260 RepID=A0ABR2Q821_9ROSI
MRVLVILLEKVMLVRLLLRLLEKVSHEGVHGDVVHEDDGGVVTQGSSEVVSEGVAGDVVYEGTYKNVHEEAVDVSMRVLVRVSMRRLLMLSMRVLRRVSIRRLLMLSMMGP